MALPPALSQAGEMKSGAPQSDLEASWRGPRWWEKPHGMDLTNYLKWQAISVVGAGILALALGISLLVTRTAIVGGVCLTLIGCAGVAVAVWAFKRRR